MVTTKMMRYLLIAIKAIAVVIATIILIRALDARSLPDLHVWHEVQFDNEFNANRDQNVSTLAAYLVQESAVFDELYEKVYANAASDSATLISRFKADSVFSSKNHERDWNRTTELVPAEPRGVVLMLHGLTDSPYSMRSTAELFYEQGYHVLVPRLPGHGTAPAGILSARWEDWQAVVQIGARHLRSNDNADLPFVIVGYSNGGALAIDYVLDAQEDDTQPRPDRVILMSPAIGITPFAFFASWNRALSWLPFFQKFAWESVQPEYDPYKYNSFPKAAGNETYELAQHVQKRLKRMAANGDLADMPPVITFVPLVDATVRTAATADHLFSSLNRPQDELVIYDVNRLVEMAQFYRPELLGLLPRLQNDVSREYQLTLVSNRSQESRQVVADSGHGAQAIEEAIDSEWPHGTYSLSHVSIPIPADDPWYGDGRSQPPTHISLGDLNQRGEKHLLVVPPAQIMRLRYNPFHGYQAQRITELLTELR